MPTENKTRIELYVGASKAKLIVDGESGLDMWRTEFCIFPLVCAETLISQMMVFVNGSFGRN